MADQAAAGSPDWAGYYAATLGRAPRPLLRGACELLGAGAGRTAIDLGCGSGVDTLALLACGWFVVAVDREPTGLALLRDRVLALNAGQLQIVCASFMEASLPRAHLIHAGYSVPFCAPGDFPAVWTDIRRALAPGGIFAGQLFGIGDSWATTSPHMSFHSPGQVRDLLEGMEVLRLDEAEWDGTATSGPKHWHVYDILAREPG